MFGGLGKKTTYRGFNRAVQATRQTGSSMKPLAVLIPGIDKKIITGATIVNDSKASFKNGKDEDYSPINNDGYLGSVTLRRALESSQNIPFVTIMEKITPNTSIKYLKKMGITTLTDGDANLALALGGIEKGISPLEMAAAYSTIANDGVYIEPIFYSKITTSDGSIFLEPKQQTKKVFSKSVAYIVKELLTQPVEGSHGTAQNCAIPNIDVAAKTGTTDDNYDRWLCGFTNYYTAVTWYGYDYNEKINYSGAQNPASVIWSNVMQSVHSGRASSGFEKPSDVITTKICASTGNVANSYCSNTYDEYFLRGTVPDKCTQHNSKNKDTSTNEIKTNTTNNTTKNENVNTNNSVKNEIQNVTNTLKNNTSINNTPTNNTNINTNTNSSNTTSGNTNSTNTNKTNNTSSAGNTISGNTNVVNNTTTSTNNTVNNSTESVNNVLGN